MKEFWSNLNERERITLSVGVIFCFIYLLYLLVFSPINHAIDSKYQILSEKKEELLWMEKVRKLQHTKKSKDLLTSSKLLTVLTEELNAIYFSQHPYSIKQTGVDEIQLNYEEVPYNGFIKWLWSFNAKYSFVIKQLNIERTNIPGVVKLSLIIST